MKILLIILGSLFIIITGYFLAIDCKSPPSIWALEYLYKIKCGQEEKLPAINLPTPPIATQLPSPTSSSSQPNLLNQKSTATQIGLLYDKPIIDYFIKQNGEIIIVDEIGKIIKIVNGQEEIINEGTAPPNYVLFTNDGSKIVFAFPNLVSVFDLTTKNWKQINEEIIEVAISPKNELAYLKKDGSIFKLDIAKDNFSPQKLIQLNNLDSYLLWKNNKELFIISKPSSVNVGAALLLDTTSKKLSLVYELPGLALNWDSKLDNGLLFSANQLGRGGKIFWVNKDLKNTQLSFITLPFKCAFKEELVNSTTTKSILICAIPKDQSFLENKILVDDWLSYDLYTEDNIYQINLDGLVDPILVNQNGLDVSQIKTYKNGLSFINRFDQKLYFINLPF